MTSELHLDDGGAGGVPLLFVHSAGGSTEHWAEQLAHHRTRRRAAAVDLRGHGRSPAPADGDYSVDALALDVVTAADALDLRRFVLVGHSLGGAVAVATAGRHPDRVAGLLLLDPASDASRLPAEEKEGLMAMLEADYEGTTERYWSTLLAASPDEVRRRILDGLRRAPRITVVETLRALLSFDPVPPLERYAGPRLSVITPLGEVPGAYHALVPGLPHRVVRGVGHWLHLDAPDVARRATEEFLDRIAG